MVVHLMALALNSGSKGTHGLKYAHYLLDMMRGVAAFSFTFNECIGDIKDLHSENQE